MKAQIRLPQAAANMSVLLTTNQNSVMQDTTSIAWLGLDAHAKNCVLAHLDDQGREVNWWKLPTQPQQLLAQIHAIPAWLDHSRNLCASPDSIKNCGVCIPNVAVNLATQEYTIRVTISQAGSDNLVAAVGWSEYSPTRCWLS